MLDKAATREAFIVAAISTGGFREGTFSKLKYRNVKEDFEANRFPIHIHVEACFIGGIWFDPDEIEALCSELSSVKIVLSNLADQLTLSNYQIRLVLQHMPETKRIEGELTYSTFISQSALKKTSLQKAAEHKRLHRLKMIKTRA